MNKYEKILCESFGPVGSHSEKYEDLEVSGYDKYRGDFLELEINYDYSNLPVEVQKFLYDLGVKHIGEDKTKELVGEDRISFYLTLHPEYEASIEGENYSATYYQPGESEYVEIKSAEGSLIPEDSFMISFDGDMTEINMSELTPEVKTWIVATSEDIVLNDDKVTDYLYQKLDDARKDI